MNKFLNVIIFLIIFSLLNFSASSKQENYYYEVQFGNLVVGKAEVFFRSTSQNLNIDIKSQTAGILDTLYEYDGVLKSSSIKNKGIWLPNKFSAGGVFNKKKRITDITWANNYKTVSYVNVPTIDLKKYHEVQKSSLINVIDPITAFMRVIEKINEEGVVIIIIDHHLEISSLPNAYAVINPKKKSDKSAYFLSFFLLIDNNSQLMLASNIDSKGKKHTNKNIKEGQCIFPFKYNRKMKNFLKKRKNGLF